MKSFSVVGNENGNLQFKVNYEKRKIKSLMHGRDEFKGTTTHVFRTISDLRDIIESDVELFKDECGLPDYYNMDVVRAILAPYLASYLGTLGYRTKIRKKGRVYVFRNGKKIAMMGVNRKLETKFFDVEEEEQLMRPLKSLAEDPEVVLNKFMERVHGRHIDEYDTYKTK